MSIPAPIVAAIIGALVAGLLTFLFNNSLKVRELMYKERIDAFNKVSDKVFQLRKLIHLLWNPGSSKRHGITIESVVKNLMEIENYLELDVDRHSSFFKESTRIELRKMEIELKLVLDYYVPGNIDVPASSFTQESIKRRFGLDDEHATILQDAVIATAARSQSCINLLMKEIGLPPSRSPYEVKGWFDEREGRRILGSVVRG